MNALKRLNEGLPALVVTILVYGLLVILIGVWFPEDKLRYITGVLIGIACAIYMAISIASVIRDAVDTGGNAVNRLKVKSVLRYLIVAAVFFLMMYFQLGSLIPAFIGVFGLKLCAYAQPFVHYHVLHDWVKEAPPESTENLEEEET